MAKKSPILYSVQKTFMWFAIISIILTGTLVVIVLMDHSREWKSYQKKFNALKLESLNTDLKTADKGLETKKIESVKEQIASAQKELAARQKEVLAVQKSLDQDSARYAKLKAEYQTEKQFTDSYRYYLEEYRKHKDPKAAGMEKKLAGSSAKTNTLKLKNEELEKSIDEKTARLSSFSDKVKQLEKELAQFLSNRSLIQKRIDKIKPSVVKDVLNAPMVDFLAPSLQVQQIVLEDIQDDYHFAKVQKVDRCTTCHLGIDQKGFENAPQPFRTHPNLDLYLSAGSSHPIEKFGCTTCHGGSGQAVSFNDTAHTPKDAKQREEWEKVHDWREMEKWEQKMLPLQYTQASCAKCHNSVVEVPKADKLNQGRKLASELGCVNCHKVNDVENHWRVGPDLRHINSKVSEEWMSKWLDNPKDFRPSTKMPRVFHLSNTHGPEDRAKNEAVIQSIVAYLTKNSEPSQLTKAPDAGDVARGEKLVKDLGCLGCHVGAGVANAGNYGPELSGLGSKVSADWLFTWLKNPKHLSADTRMPNLRLSDEEASDITRYLLSLKNPEFESKTVQSAKMSVVDELILESMQGTLRRSEAEAELKKMSGEDKMQYLGKKSIGHQGCYSCHSIKGFDSTPSIGADLSDEGRKDIHKFDFGFTHIEHTRHDWIVQKLKNPRIFDDGKLKNYYEKLRMPQFTLTDQEVEALTTFVLSQTEEQMPLAAQRTLSSDDVKTEEGRLLVQKLNCTGCHAMDGKLGTLREITEDKGAAPPNISGEGAKAQEKWLYHFLSAPTPIRPWLSYRMPTFDLSDNELTTLVHYFNNLSHQELSVTGTVIPETTPEKLATGKLLFESLQCIKCHQITQEAAALGTSFLAPDLTLTKQRLKPDWVHQWVKDPQVLEEGTMMPTFFSDGQSPLPDILGGDAEKQIEAIHDYLYRYETSASESSSKS
jgi:mono/diheme cytochrome c family protein